MESIPWRTDRELTPALAARLIERRFPELAPVRARDYSEGWDSEALLVNERWVFLFPKRRVIVEPFLRGVRLTRLVADALPLPVPDFRFVGEPDAEFPYAFAGYEKIPGLPGCDVRPDREQWPDLADVLGETLGALHALDPEPFGEPPWPAPEDPFPPAIAAAVREGLGDRVDARVEAYLRGEVEPPPPSPLDPVPTHADLLGYHILLDPSGGRITGILDWMDMGLGDPAADFVGLLLWLGEDFLDMALDRYPRPVDAGIRDRIRHRARVCALWEYGWARHPDSFFDPAIGCGWIERAFAD